MQYVGSIGLIIVIEIIPICYYTRVDGQEWNNFLWDGPISIYERENVAFSLTVR